MVDIIVGCTYTELCEAVEQHDQELTGRLLPVIKQRIDEATRALSNCLEIKDIAVHWYGISSLLVSLPCLH